MEVREGGGGRGKKGRRGKGGSDYVDISPPNCLLVLSLFLEKRKIIIITNLPSSPPSSPSFSPFQVSKIPVFISEIGDILQILRQQLTFNEVYSSCFPEQGWGGKGEKGREGEGGGKVVVEVEAECPGVIYICLMSEKIRGLSLSISIYFSLGGRMEVRMGGGGRGGGGEKGKEGEEEEGLPLGVGRVEEILNKTKSVPILVHNLLKAVS